MSTNDKITKHQVGRFTFIFEPTKKSGGSVSHYMHIEVDGKRITPQNAGAFVNMDEGQYDPIIINDRSYEIPLTLIIKDRFAFVNYIKYVDAEKITSYSDAKSKGLINLWCRNENK